MKAVDDCVFCKIGAGEIPSFMVYEDDFVFAFMDVGPLAEGHLLVIPKDHYGRLEEMPGELVGRIAECLPKLAAAVIEASGCEGYNVLQNNGVCAGQAVAHVHFHIIPRCQGDGLGYRWNAGTYAEGGDKAMHEKLLAALH